LYNKTYAFWNLNILGITRGTSSILTSLSFGDYWISKGFHFILFSCPISIHPLFNIFFFFVCYRFALQFRMIKSEGRHHLGTLIIFKDQ